MKENIAACVRGIWRVGLLGFGASVCVVSAGWAGEAGALSFSLAGHPEDAPGLVGLGQTEELVLRAGASAGGRLTLSAETGAERIAVLGAESGGAARALALPQAWTLAAGASAPRLRVKGIGLSGGTPGDVRLRAAFDDGRSADLALTVVSNAFTVYCDQPGDGGSRTPARFSKGALDVGHTCWMFSSSHPALLPKALQPYVNVPLGFMRRHLERFSLEAAKAGPGVFIFPDDSGPARADVAYTWPLGPRALADGLAYCAALHGDPGLYDPNTRNCTDVAIGAGAAAGVAVPDTPGRWLGGGGSNPGDLGEDLRELIRREQEQDGRTAGEQDGR
jgi:hypothetical protein